MRDNINLQVELEIAKAMNAIKRRLQLREFWMLANHDPTIPRDQLTAQMEKELKDAH